MNRKIPYENILLMNNEQLIKLVLEYRAQHQDYKIQNDLFKQLIKNYAALSNELKSNVERVTNLSVTDPLTQIYNRLKFNEELDKRIKSYRNHKAPFSIIMFDIDHFKNVNDKYGHDIGDLVLKIWYATGTFRLAQDQKMKQCSQNVHLLFHLILFKNPRNNREFFI